MSRKKSSSLPPWFKFPLIAVGIMAGVKITYYNLGVDIQAASNHQIFIHMALIILSIFFTLQEMDKQPDRPPTFIDDAKDGFKAGAMYAVLATALVVIYYNFIDSTFFPEMQQRIFENSTGEENELTEDEQREKIESFFNLSNWTLATLTGYLALAIVYSLLMALFMKLLRKVRYGGGNHQSPNNDLPN